MTREIIENSRRGLSSKGWKNYRAYVTPEHKKKLDDYQIDNKFENADLAMNDILTKFFGGKVK